LRFFSFGGYGLALAALALAALALVFFGAYDSYPRDSIFLGFIVEQTALDSIPQGKQKCVGYFPPFFQLRFRSTV